MDKILALYQGLHDSLGTNEICEDFCTRMIRTIQDAVDRIPFGAKVGLRCADRCMASLIKNIDLTKTNVVGVYDLMRNGDQFFGYPILSADQLTDESCDYVIFATYTYRNAILQELHGYGGKIIDIYNLLNEHGIELRGPFNHYQLGTPLVLNFFYLRYWEAPDLNLKKAALQEFLQAAVEYKDFALIYKVYEENGGPEGKYPVLIETWERTRRLLDAIHAKIRERKQPDIIAFWTDAVSYFDLPNMPGLEAKINDGCFFERAYTNSPWTRPVMQAMFQKLLPIDGFPATQNIISGETSTFIPYLESKGYEFRWVSFPVWAMDPQYRISHVEQYMSNSLIWWYGLQSLLVSERPCFYIFHFLIEGHHPTLSPDLTEFDLLRPDLHAKGTKALEQRRNTLAYLDRCLMLYNWLLGTKTQLFFSDHGSFWSDAAEWSEERLHVYFLILGKSVPRQKIKKFFSYLNFQELVQWLIEPEENSLDCALMDEAISQDVDYYGESTVNATINFVKKGYPHNGIAFRGIRTGNCKYILNALGEEYYYIINEDGTETRTPLEDDALRAELQSKCGTCFIDIRKYDKFKHSRKLYESILQDHPELGPPLWITGEN